MMMSPMYSSSMAYQVILVYPGDIVIYGSNSSDHMMSHKWCWTCRLENMPNCLIVKCVIDTHSVFMAQTAAPSLTLSVCIVQVVAMLA